MSINYDSNPNQRHMVINRTLPKKGEKKRFLTVYCESIEKAAQELSGEVPFKLYIYLLCNEDKYDLWFSPATFAKLYGVSTGAARRAVKELEDKGYIEEMGSNKLAFYEEPQEKNEIILPISQERRILGKDKNGNDVIVSFDTFYAKVSSKYTDSIIMEQWNKFQLVEGDN